MRELDGLLGLVESHCLISVITKDREALTADMVDTPPPPPPPDTLLTMSPPAFSTETYPTLTAKQPSTDSQDSTEDSQGVPVAMASGELSVRVKIKQSETLPGPKLEVEGVLGSLHFLLSPQQLQMLIEMASGIASIGKDP